MNHFGVKLMTAFKKKKKRETRKYTGFTQFSFGGVMNPAEGKKKTLVWWF